MAAQARAGVIATSVDGRTPGQQLNVIGTRAEALMADQQKVWRELRRLLEDAGIEVSQAAPLSDADRNWLDAWFMERAFPVLTSVAIDPAHPFPFVPNMGLVMALELVREKDKRAMHALLPIPGQIERLIRLPVSGATIRFIMLEDLIQLFLDRVLPAFRIVGNGMFRVIRDTDVESEEEAEDLVRSYETALKRRRRGIAIHLSTGRGQEHTITS